MAILNVNLVKSELRIDGTADDARLNLLIDEAIYCLQQYKDLTIVETVIDANTQVALNSLDKRFVYLYVAVFYDNRTDLIEAYRTVLEMIRHN